MCAKAETFTKWITEVCVDLHSPISKIDFECNAQQSPRNANQVTIICDFGTLTQPAHTPHKHTCAVNAYAWSIYVSSVLSMFDMGYHLHHQDIGYYGHKLGLHRQFESTTAPITANDWHFFYGNHKRSIRSNILIANMGAR